MNNIFEYASAAYFGIGGFGMLHRINKFVRPASGNFIVNAAIGTIEIGGGIIFAAVGFVVGSAIHKIVSETVKDINEKEKPSDNKDDDCGSYKFYADGRVVKEPADDPIIFKDVFEEEVLKKGGKADE